MNLDGTAFFTCSMDQMLYYSTTNTTVEDKDLKTCYSHFRSICGKFVRKCRNLMRGDDHELFAGNGLSKNHAYSIIGAEEYKGKRFVKLRNPWGIADWLGSWSEGSKKWDEVCGSEEEAQNALGLDSEQSADFVMECRCSDVLLL